MSVASIASAPEAFDYVRSLVMQRAAIVLEPSKTYLVDVRLGPIAQRHGLPTVADLVAKLQRQPFGPMHEDVVEALTTNETSFFRDVAPFEAMRKTILPQMIQKREGERSLSIWSAACSSGQELYSIAMTLREHFPAINSWNLQLLGTDLARTMVDRAKAGTFTQTEVNRGLPAACLVKYFQRQGLNWQLSEDIRKLTSWRKINLVEPWSGIPTMDVIFLRNVLIYFSPETKRKVLSQVRKVLRPDGFLFLGGAETTMNLDDSFERFPCDGAVCYRMRF